MKDNYIGLTVDWIVVKLRLVFWMNGSDVYDLILPLTPENMMEQSECDSVNLLFLYLLASLSLSSV
jgi:hypothetical protein